MEVILLWCVSSPLYIDRRKYWESDRYFNGYVGEIVMYSRAVINEERKAVEKYLSKNEALYSVINF